MSASIKLIGWPCASGRAVAVNRDGDKLPSVVFIRHTETQAGDITGTGTGNGHGPGLKPARAVGVGNDDEYNRAAAEVQACQRSQWVADLLAGEHALGIALMLLAGGREFVAGTGARLNGNGMAGRAARYIKSRRGVTPSDTSLDDAAAAAAAALVPQVAVWEYVLGIDGELPVNRIREDACIRRHLSGVAWKAAFHSMDGAGGDSYFSGRQARETVETVSLALDAGQLASQVASLQACMSGGRELLETSEQVNRRALSSWVWRSMVAAPGRGANEARARDGARRRAKFLIRLIHGSSWADAARLAGYIDGAMAAKKLAESHTWAQLGRAAADTSSGHPMAVALAAQWRKAARAEIRARRAARPFLRTTAAAGARRKVPVGVVTPGGAVLLRGVARGSNRTAGERRQALRDYQRCGAVHYSPSPAPRVTHRIRSLAVDIGKAASVAIAKREQAARVTSAAASRLNAFRARSTAEFKRASRGLRAGINR